MQELVQGEATELPPNTFVWVLARIHGLSGWFPQGSGQAIVGNNSRWSVFTTYGIPSNSGQQFDVMVAVFDRPGNAAIQQWANNADATGVYRPMQMPRNEPNCPPKIIAVTRQ